MYRVTWGKDKLIVNNSIICITTFISFLLSVSCTSFIDDEFKSIEPDFLEYYDMFISESKIRGYDFSDQSVMIYYQSHDEGVIGLTHAQRNGTVQISIDKKLWSKQSLINKEITMMHEFGHGFLKLDHTNGCDIMNTELVKCMKTQYHINKKQMLDKLIN